MTDVDREIAANIEHLVGKELEDVDPYLRVWEQVTDYVNGEIPCRWVVETAL